MSVSGRPVRVLLADDHALVRRGLRLILDGEPDFTVVAEAADGVEALAAGVCGVADLAVLDIAMPRMTGLQAARQLARRRPDLALLMLSMHDSEQYLLEAARAGAAGYVLKSVADRDLLAACRAVMRGESFPHPGMTGSAIATVLRRHAGTPPADRLLSAREEEVVKLISEGHSGREIADLLTISAKTVERHRANILQKLGLRDRVDLVRYAIRTGLTTP
jgi:DNA-binding NarL/FixJ family response regulator